MLTKKIEGILIEAVEKAFPDGGGGFFCTVLQKDGTPFAFWAQKELAVRVSHPHEVDMDGEWPGELEDNWKLSGRPWGGKIKWSLME